MRNKNKLRKSKKGFSLVELIVTIAILAVLIAVFAPSLLAYTERSRANKDLKAMDELANTIRIALANEKIYDEMMQYCVNDNVSCYIDTPSEDGLTAVVTKIATANVPKQYMFDSTTRQADETLYTAAGSMRGVTITFYPNTSQSSSTYEIKNGVINKFVGQYSTVKSNAYLYNEIRDVVGESIVARSKTYKNSEYTVFIRMGTTGGNDSEAQDSITVYGQYSGTNLSADDHIYEIALGRTSESVDGIVNNNTTGSYYETSDLISSGTYIPGDGTIIIEETTHQDTIPAGAVYYVGVDADTLSNYESAASAIYREGDPFPVTRNGDIYLYGDYEYRYNRYVNGNGYWSTSSQNGWGVRPVTPNKSTYGEILKRINYIDIKLMVNSFRECTNLITAPAIPGGVTTLYSAFRGCTSLRNTSHIPTGVSELSYTFADCTSLTSLPSMSGSGKSTYCTFMNCTSLEAVSIPSAIENLGYGTFLGCQYLDSITITLKCKTIDAEALPVPSSEYIPYATGKWYSSSWSDSGKSYTPTELAAAQRTATRTYRATLMCAFDLNGVVNGKSLSNLGNAATCDIYINGVLVANDRYDFCGYYPIGSTYEFKDIKPKDGYTYLGEKSNIPLSGTIGVKGVRVYLKFSNQ